MTLATHLFPSHTAEGPGVFTADICVCASVRFGSGANSVINAPPRRLESSRSRLRDAFESRRRQ